MILYSINEITLKMDERVDLPDPQISEEKIMQGIKDKVKKDPNLLRGLDERKKRLYKQMLRSHS